MDYGSFKKIEFRRKFWKLFGVDISVFDPATNNMIGFINQKTLMLKPDVYLYTDKTKQNTVLNLKKQTIASFNPTYTMTDMEKNVVLGSLQFNDFRSFLSRWHIDIKDNNGNVYGYVNETSNSLAIIRRWIGLISEFAELILMFVPQTFDIYYAPNGQNPQLVGRIIHRKNPVIVKMGLDLNDAQVVIDPKINLAVCTLLSLRDMSKNA